MCFELCLAVQSCVSRVNSSGLGTQPWGASGLSLMILEVLLLMRTDWGVLVRNSGFQVQREVLTHGRLSFPAGLCGMVVLNAELKSLNSILTLLKLYFFVPIRKNEMVGSSDGIISTGPVR